MENPARSLLAAMGLGFVSGYHSLTTVSAVAFLALRYAYDAGYRDARVVEEESAKGVPRAVEEEQENDDNEEIDEGQWHKPSACENEKKEDVGRTTNDPEFENGFADERNVQMSDQETVITAIDTVSGMRDPSREHEEKGFEAEREHKETSSRRCAVTGRGRRFSQVLEPTICELDLDANCEAADWGIDPEEEFFECLVLGSVWIRIIEMANRNVRIIARAGRPVC